MTISLKTVAEAARLLDEKYPKWENKIDVDKLNLSEPYACILGQLYGGWIEGKTAFFGIDYYDVDYYTINLFCKNTDNREAWVSEILSRRKNKGMNFEQALTLMRQGKYVRRRGWKNKEFRITINDKQFINQCRKSDSYWSPDDCLSDDWELWQKSKKRFDELKYGDKFTYGGDSHSVYERRPSVNTIHSVSIGAAEYLGTGDIYIFDGKMEVEVVD
jgi:hypothetical protein